MNASWPPQVSPELLAAQQRLLALREQLGVDPGQRHDEVETRHSKPMMSLLDGGQALLLERRRREVVEQGQGAGDTRLGKPVVYLPPTEPLEGTQERDFFSRIPKGTALSDQLTPSIQEENKNIRRTLAVYPSLAMGMLESGLSAAGRVYWLLRYLDGHGRGWLESELARDWLTVRSSDLHLCSWRRLRQLLDQGDGIFWTRDGGGRIWLKGAAVVAQNLAVSRLEGCPVEVPVTAMLGGIQTVRAHFYASFHSCRRGGGPISRLSLRQKTSVPERTQLDYDKVARIQRQENIAIGEKLNKVTLEEGAWRHGRAQFQFLDVDGQQGPSHREYVAWHLPNSYQGPHAKRQKGRQKKINQRLVDLVMKGMRGNGREQVEQVFWPHGAAAARAYNRQPENDAYWSAGKSRTNQVTLWRSFSGVT